MTSEDISQHNSADNLDFYEAAARFLSETAASGEPHVILKNWIRRYPAFAIELTEIAYAQIVSGDNWNSTLDDSVDASVLASARRVIARKRSNVAPLSSLTGAARELGLAPNKLAAEVRIDLSILAKLEQRLVIASTVPAALLESIGKTIGRSVSDVFDYLTLPPRLAASAQYKSAQAPEIKRTSQESFGRIVEASLSITDSDRKFWLDQLDNLGNN